MADNQLLGIRSIIAYNGGGSSRVEGGHMGVRISRANGNDDGKPVKKKNTGCHCYVGIIMVCTSCAYLLANMSTTHQSFAFHLNVRGLDPPTF